MSTKCSVMLRPDSIGRNDRITKVRAGAFSARFLDYASVRLTRCGATTLLFLPIIPQGRKVRQDGRPMYFITLCIIDYCTKKQPTADRASPSLSSTLT